MSAIPPSWLASGIQGVGSQQKSAEARDRDASQAAAKAGAESPFSHELTDAIAAGDRDSQIDAEGQGQGGQGRSPADDETPSGEPAESKQMKDNGTGGLVDFQA